MQQPAPIMPEPALQVVHADVTTLAVDAIAFCCFSAAHVAAYERALGE